MTDRLSGELHSFLVRMAYTPESVSHDTEHGMEHIMHLLVPEDEAAVVSYNGLFGTERMSLEDIARSRNMSEEDMMATIDNCIRKIAVTPEWQLIKEKIKYK